MRVTGPGHMLLLECFRFCGLRLDGSIQTCKSQECIFLVSNMRGFIYRSDKGNVLGGRKLRFICNNRPLFRACTYIGVSISFMPLQATFYKENGCQDSNTME